MGGAVSCLHLVYERKENKLFASELSAWLLGSHPRDPEPRVWGPAGWHALSPGGIGTWVDVLEEEGEFCLSPHDSCDIGIVQSAVCDSSKLKITFIKCLVTQDSSPR